jgi:hypothetical protein
MPDLIRHFFVQQTSAQLHCLVPRKNRATGKTFPAVSVVVDVAAKRKPVTILFALISANNTPL